MLGEGGYRLGFMELWTGAAIGVVGVTLASGLLASGEWLVRVGRTGQRDHEHWFLASIVLLLVAGADRLTLLDGQLLVLAGLLFPWWDASRRRRSPLRGVGAGYSRVGNCGLVMLSATAAGVGGLAVCFVMTKFADELRGAPGGWNGLSWRDVLQIVADVARSRPRLQGLSALAPSALFAGVAAVAILWITALRGVVQRVASIVAGAVFVGGGLLILLLAYSQIASGVFG